MIIKVPIYFEIEEKFSPDEIQELTLAVQGLLTKDINRVNLGMRFSYKIFGRSIKMNLISRQQVMTRITGPNTAE